MSGHHSGDSSLSKSAVASRADELLPEYQQIIANIPPEAGFGGIWESEMLLFYATVKPLAPKQILESGRARGKSTLILARCFPESHIISVEYARESENASVAEAKSAEDTIFFAPFKDMPAAIPASEQAELRSEALKAIRNSVIMGADFYESSADMEREGQSIPMGISAGTYLGLKINEPK